MLFMPTVTIKGWPNLLSKERERERERKNQKSLDWQCSRIAVFRLWLEAREVAPSNKFYIFV